MEDFNINDTLQDKSYNDSDIYYNDDDYKGAELTEYVFTCIIICIGIPLTLVAIRGVFSLVRNNHVTPIYVINLLISDLIQLCCMIVEVVKPKYLIMEIVYDYIYHFGVLASVGFMVCVALERYLVIAWPLWYHFEQNIKISVVVSVVVWALPLVFFLFSFLAVYFEVAVQNLAIILAVYFLLPLPLFIFFLIGTLKALSASRVPLDEKRRIVAILVVVILIYILLFLPSIIRFLQEEATNNVTLSCASFTLLKFSPLADLFLYVFMRKGAVEKLLCCCRKDSNGISSPTVCQLRAVQI